MGEKFVVGEWWWVCKSIIVFSFDFRQAEQKGREKSSRRLELKEDRAARK
jgi:hypothetical protein